MSDMEIVIGTDGVARRAPKYRLTVYADESEDLLRAENLFGAHETIIEMCALVRQANAEGTSAGDLHAVPMSLWEKIVGQAMALERDGVLPPKNRGAKPASGGAKTAGQGGSLTLKPKPRTTVSTRTISRSGPAADSEPSSPKTETPPQADDPSGLDPDPRARDPGGRARRRSGDESSPERFVQAVAEGHLA